MAYVQKRDFVFRRNGRVHLNRGGGQFSRLLAAEVCASAVVMVVMLDTPCSEVVWRVLDTHSIHQFPLHFPTRASPCAIVFQLDSTVILTCIYSVLLIKNTRWIKITTNTEENLFNRLKPAGHVMNQQFNIQQLYALSTMYLCSVFIWE